MASVRLDGNEQREGKCVDDAKKSLKGPLIVASLSYQRTHRNGCKRKKT